MHRTCWSGPTFFIVGITAASDISPRSSFSRSRSLARSVCSAVTDVPQLMRSMAPLLMNACAMPVELNPRSPSSRSRPHRIAPHCVSHETGPDAAERTPSPGDRGYPASPSAPRACKSTRLYFEYGSLVNSETSCSTARPLILTSPDPPSRRTGSKGIRRVATYQDEVVSAAWQIAEECSSNRPLLTVESQDVCK